MVIWHKTPYLVFYNSNDKNKVSVKGNVVFNATPKKEDISNNNNNSWWTRYLGFKWRQGPLLINYSCSQEYLHRAS